MSDDDVCRDERGRIVKGSPGLHRKQEPQDNPPDLDTSFDDDIIAAANSSVNHAARLGVVLGAKIFVTRARRISPRS